MPTTDPLPLHQPDALAHRYEAHILLAVSRRTGDDPDALRLDKDASFISEANPNEYGFMVITPSGFYGVSAMLNDTGKLTEFTCQGLQFD